MSESYSMEVVPLFSKVYGDGAPLIILHGLFGMGDNWVTHAKNWAEMGWEVHAVDQRNHGRSPHHTVHNYDVMASDLEAYMDAKGLKTAVILGHSMGGKTAMHFAVSRPERVRALVVVDIAPKAYPIHHQGYINAMKSVDFDAVKSRGAVDAVLAKSVENAGIRQFFMKSLYWVTKEKLTFRFNLDALEDQLQEVGTPLEFGYFDRPTLFIAGGASGYIAAEDEDAILDHFPAAHIETIANAGHWVHAEAREPFSALVVDFLENLV